MASPAPDNDDSEADSASSHYPWTTSQAILFQTCSNVRRHQYGYVTPDQLERFRVSVSPVTIEVEPIVMDPSNRAYHSIVNILQHFSMEDCAHDVVKAYWMRLLDGFTSLSTLDPNEELEALLKKIFAFILGETPESLVKRDGNFDGVVVWCVYPLSFCSGLGYLSNHLCKATTLACHGCRG